MIQAFGLTSNPRKGLPPAVDDVSFEARAGRVTALLGDARAGKTTALRLMLELQQGRGLTYFRGRPLHRIAHPTREVGVLLGEVPGHPGRTVHGHLRMLCAAAGVSVRRADEVLEVVGLVSLREERLGTLSRGMDRRLGLACALLSDPHTLVLDDPADGLSARESRWLFGMLRAHADQGGTVLVTTADPKEAARTADRVVTLERGRLVADQEAAEFARTRLRPRVAVRSPQSTRLAAALAKEARTARRSVEVVQERGNRLSVYGSTCADVGETAFRHGILVLQLADEIGDMGPGAGTGAGADVAVPQDQEEPEARVQEQEAAAAGSAESDARVSAVASEDLADASPSGSDTHAVTVDKAPADVVAATSETPHATMVPPARRTPPADIYADTYADADSASGARPDAVAKDGAAPAPHPTASPAASRAPHSDVTAKRSPHSDPATNRAPLPESSAIRAPHPESSSGRPAHPDPATNGAPHPTSAANGTAHPAPTVNGTPHPAPTTNGSPHSAAAPNASPPAAPGAAPKPHPAEPTAAPTSQPAKAPATPARSTTQSTPAAGRATPSPAATQANGASKPPNGHAKHFLDPVRPSLGPAEPSTAPAIAPHRPTKTPAHPAGLARPSRPTAPATPASAATRTSAAPPARPAAPVTSRELESLPSLPPPIAVRAAPSPLRPLRYELRRAAGVSTGFVTAATVLVVSALTAVLLARLGHTPHERLLAAWPSEVPLPPAAIGAGLLGALAFGDEFRHPALAVDRGTVPRRLGLLAAKLAVSGATALALAVLTVGCNAEVLYLVYGRELARVPADWLSLSASWLGLTVGCAWAGVLAAGVFRSTAGGLAAVVSVPILVVPLVQRLVEGPSVRTAAGFPMRMREMFLLQWPFGGERYLSAVARVISQPVGGALTLSLTALLCAYAVTTLRSRAR